MVGADAFVFVVHPSVLSYHYVYTILFTLLPKIRARTTKPANNLIQVKISETGYRQKIEHDPRLNHFF